MAKFQQILSVQSIGELYRKKEAKRAQRELERRQHKQADQQQQQPHLLTPAIRTPLLTEAQSYASGDLAELYASLGLSVGDFGEDLNGAELHSSEGYEHIMCTETRTSASEIGDGTGATAQPISLPDEIKPDALCSRPPTVPSPGGASPSAGALPLAPDLAPDLARPRTGGLRPASRVVSEAVGDDDSTNTCDQDDTDAESSCQETPVSSSEQTDDDTAGAVAEPCFSETDARASSSPAVSSWPGDPISSGVAEGPTAASPGMEVEQVDSLSPPSPLSDPAFVSGQVSHKSAGRRKRDLEAVEDGNESYEPRSAKRRKQQAATALTRSLRRLPCRISADQPGERLSSQSQNPLARRPGARERSGVDLPSSSTSHALDSRRQPKRRKRRASCHLTSVRRRPAGSEVRPSTPTETTPALSYRSSGQNQIDDRLTTGTDPQLPPWSFGRSSARPGMTRAMSVRTLASPAVAKASPLAATCHTCGFSAGHLLQLSDAVEALVGSSARLSDGEKGMVMLRLFLGSVRDYATGLSHDVTAAVQSGPYSTTEQDPTTHAAIRPPTGGTAQETCEGVGNDTDDGSDSQSDAVDPDDAESCGVLDEGEVRPLLRRRWSRVEELRLDAWVEEGKGWPWIAKKLHRSEAAVLQHWGIMTNKDRGSARSRP